MSAYCEVIRLFKTAFDAKVISDRIECGKFNWIIDINDDHPGKGFGSWLFVQDFEAGCTAAKQGQKGEANNRWFHIKV